MVSPLYEFLQMINEHKHLQNGLLRIKNLQEGWGRAPLLQRVFSVVAPKDCRKLVENEHQKAALIQL